MLAQVPMWKSECESLIEAEMKLFVVTQQ